MIKRMCFALIVFAIAIRPNWAVDEVIYASDSTYTTGSHTGGIQEAINACGAGYSSKGCIVRLPKGDVVITCTINIGGLLNTTAKEGVVLQGYGAGEYASGAIATGGTTLIWNGDGGCGTTMILASATNKLRIQDVAFVMDEDNDNSNVADYAIRLTGNATYGTSGVLLENLLIHGSTTSTTTVGIRLDGLPSGTNADRNPQVDMVAVRDVHAVHLDTCVEIASIQSQIIDVDHLDCLFYNSVGLDLIGGSATIENSFFGSSSDSIAGIRLSSSPVAPYFETEEVSITGSGFETSSGNAIKIEDNCEECGRKYATLIEGNNFLMLDHSLYMIDSDTEGAVSVNSNTFGADGNYTTTLRFDSSQPNQVFASGNQLGHQGTLVWDVSGSSTLSCTSSSAGRQFEDTNCNQVMDSGESLLVSAASTDTLTNKTLDTAGTGNVLKINGTQLTSVTGSGSAVLASSPTLVTPNLGVATATTVNKVAITAPSSSATLTIANGKTATINNSLTLAGTDSTTLTFQGTDTYVGRASTDTLTNKDVTSLTNTLPITSIIGFTGVNPATAIYCGPSTGFCSSTETASALQLPPLILSNLRCKSSVAPGSGKSWPITLRSASTNTSMTCTISGTNTQCSDTNAFTVNGSDEVALKIDRAGSPGPTTTVTIECIASARPGANL